MRKPEWAARPEREARQGGWELVIISCRDISRLRYGCGWSTALTPAPEPLSKPRLELLSPFPYHVRRFLRFSEDAARAAGITTQQYQLLLHTQGFPDRDWATIGELAERLQTLHHSAAALATRCEELGLVERRSHEFDARVVEVHLTPE